MISPQLQISIVEITHNFSMKCIVLLRNNNKEKRSNYFFYEINNELSGND